MAVWLSLHALFPEIEVLTEPITGASSSIRKIVAPYVQRQYSGYVAWRGTVNEKEISDESRKVFGDKMTFCAAKRSYILMQAHSFIVQPVW